MVLQFSSVPYWDFSLEPISYHLHVTSALFLLKMLLFIIVITTSTDSMEIHTLRAL